MDMVEFLAVMSNMQNLTFLKFVDVLPSARDFLSSGGLDTSPTINFPLLVHLEVSAPLSTTALLLSCINIPPTTKLDLEPLFERGSSIRDYVPISSFLARQFSQPSSAGGPVLRSFGLDAGSLAILAFDIDYEPPSPLKRVGYDLPLRIVLGEMEYNDADDRVLSVSDEQCIISNICCSLPLTSIESLHIIQPRRLQSNILEEILGCLCGLRYMRLSYGDMPDLSMLSLTACKPSDDSGGNRTLVKIQRWITFSCPHWRR